MWCGPFMFIFTTTVFEFCSTYFIYYISFILPTLFISSFISPTLPILYHYPCYFNYFMQSILSSFVIAKLYSCSVLSKHFVNHVFKSAIQIKLLLKLLLIEN